MEVPHKLPLFLLSSLIFFTTTIPLSEQARLLLPLTHTLSKSHNATRQQLLRHSSLRSAARHSAHRRQVSLPLSPGSDYTLSLAVGLTAVDLYMDTGSDLVWFPCAPFECILCEGKPNSTSPPIPPPAASSPLPCASNLCSAAHSAAPSSDLCAVAGCRLDDIETSSCQPQSHPCPAFYYAYGDGSLIGHLRRGPLSLPAAVASGGEPLRLKDFTFACAGSALAEPVGVAGFGGGMLSLPAQLATISPDLAARFSYCLVAHSFQPGRINRPSPLILGRSESESRTGPDPFVYTPFLLNPKYPYFYSVGLESISVGGTRIETRPELRNVDGGGNGGMVVDSGTTFTMLPSALHAQVANEFDRRMRAAGLNRSAETEAETGLAPCYSYSGRAEARLVPGLGLRFAGNASVPLPRRNYFMGFQRGGEGVGCLMLMSGGDGDTSDADSGGPAATLGNYQQQGFEVVYDLERKRVGFARRRCGALWDSVSRG